MRLRLACVLAAALGCAPAEDRAGASGAPPDTAVYAQVDTAAVRVPPELSAFCRPGTASMRPAAAPASLPAGPGEDVTASTVYANPLASLNQPVRCVVRRAQDWAALWSAMRRHIHASPPQPPPPVDFGARMVLMAGMGPRPTMGYGITISRVRRTQAGLVVTVVQHTTGGCEVGMAETEPVHAVSVPREDVAVHFVEMARYGGGCGG